MNDELLRVEHAADWYLAEQMAFDRRLIRFRYETLLPHLKGPEGLEIGPAEGEMTQFLLSHFERLTVVEGSMKLLSRIPKSDNLVKVHSLFEDYEPTVRFHTIIMEHVLEHVDDPIRLLKRARAWLAPGGRLLAGVPNGNSIHRLAAVKMDLLPHPCALNSRDHALGHRRVYTHAAFRADIQAAGLNVEEMGGLFLKPVSNQQIQDHWTPAMIQGFYELGKDLPELAAEIYAVCTVGG